MATCLDANALSAPARCLHCSAKLDAAGAGRTAVPPNWEMWVCSCVCACVYLTVCNCKLILAQVLQLCFWTAYSSASDLKNVSVRMCVRMCVCVCLCVFDCVRWQAYTCPGLTAVPLTWTMCVHVCLCMCATASLYVLCVQVLQQFLWLKEYECARVCVFMWVWVCAIAKYSHYCTCINLWYIRSLTTDH